MERVEDFDNTIEDIGQDKFKYRFRQFLVASAGALWGLIVGVLNGYSSIIFTQIRQSNELTITVEEEGWIASATALAMIPGNLIIGWILDTYGRRYPAITVEFVNLVGLVTTYFGGTNLALIAGRLLSGLYIGLSFPIYLTYISEITSPKYRALIISLTAAGTSTGVLIIQLLGNYVQWYNLALVFTFVPFYNSAIFCYTKESYISYINRNNLKQAKEVFIWFKGTSSSSEREFGKATDTNDLEQSWNFLGVLTILKQKAFLIPFLITNIIYLTDNFSGTQSALTFYTTDTLNLITDNGEYQYYAIILLNVFVILAVLSGSFLTRLLSVRIIVLVCTYILAAFLLNLSLSMYLLTKYPGNQVLTLVALLSVTGCGFFNSLGLACMESVICGEVYPASVRGIGCSLSQAMSALYLFIAVKANPGMFEVLGGAGSFLFFGCVALIGTTIIYFMLPNTQNKSLKEIENMFTKNECCYFNK